MKAKIVNPDKLILIPNDTSKTNLLVACQILKPFMTEGQLIVLAEGAGLSMKGKDAFEKIYFEEKLLEMAEIIQKMPKTGETRKQDKKAIAYLHYFINGMNFYITEKDKGCATDVPEEKYKQHQAFGLADLYQDGGETGYISIEEMITTTPIQLDLHWQPKTLAEIRSSK